MGKKRIKEKSPDELQTERVTAALEETDRTGRAPAFVRENPGQFLRDMYDVWHRQGGKEGGRWRNSIRKMRDEWLVGRSHVPSLHPKLMGRVKLTRKDVRALLDLFLGRWRWAEGDDPLNSITNDGYVGFPTIDRKRLRVLILDNIVKSSERTSSIHLPSQNNDRDDFEETQRRWTDVATVLYECDALLTLSRHKISVGSNPVETIKTFWNLMNNVYEYDCTHGFSDRLMIWIIDFGSRNVNDDEAFDEYFNAGLLALQLHSVSDFNLTKSEKNPPLPQLRMSESREKEARWRWFVERTAIVVQNLRMEDYNTLYPGDQELVAPNSIRLEGYRRDRGPHAYR